MLVHPICHHIKVAPYNSLVTYYCVHYDRSISWYNNVLALNYWALYHVKSYSLAYNLSMKF